MTSFWTSPPQAPLGSWSNIRRPSIIACIPAYAGSTSTLRIFRRLGEPMGYTIRTPGDDEYTAGRPEAARNFADYQPFNTIYYWRSFHDCACSLRASKISLENFRYLAAYRDPRDVLISMYNNLAHDHPLPPEESHQKAFLQLREQVKSKGLQDFVVNQASSYRTTFFRSMKEFADMVPANRLLFLSYAKLCLDLPDYVRKMALLMDLNPPSVLIDEILQTEDVNKKDKMEYSPCHFPRSSPLPGRFRRELEAATIQQLNSEFSDILSWMAAADDPQFSSTYM
ncbi:MAG TPA: sulfotransferase domain-containing protein [Rhodocyclaceae bacterium]|nr:sulfotransferase domain-containing protein [Rhodocyclaceae bacterium]